MSKGKIKRENHLFSNNFGTNFVSILIPIGAYSSYLKEKLSLDDPLHYSAQLVWFEGSGYLEYKVKNPLSKNSQVKTLRLFFEVCSEAEGYSLDRKTDISIYINGKKLANIQ